jgi:hypothetical protein
MDISLLDRALWIAGFFGHAILLLVLIVRGRWRMFPVFTALIGFSVFRTVSLYAIYLYGRAELYQTVFWGAAIIDLALQVALVFEIAQIVLKPTGTWVRDARFVFLIVGTAGGLLAIGLVFAVNPGLPDSLSAWIEKANLLAIMLICELFVSMMLASTRLGLAWKDHVMGLSRGLTGWAIVALLVEAAHSYLGPNWHAAALDHARMMSYLGANAYWLAIFWQSEPESRTLSDEMQRYLFELHQQVNFGLDSVSSTKRES